MKFLFCLLALVLLAQSAQAQVPATGAGRGALPGNIKVGGGGGGGGGGYVGPGNVVSGALVWYGFRAFNNTLANSGASTTAVADVLGTSTATGCTIFLKGNGTGDVDLTTSGAGGVGSQCASGATTFCTVTNPSCTISKLYDQSGASSCSGACPVVQPTAGSQPTLMFSCVGTVPCGVAIIGKNISSTATLGASTAQPISMSGVANSNNGGTSAIIIATSNSGDAQFYFEAATSASIYAGSGPLDATYVASTTIARNDVANGASSVINNDGTETTGGAGTGGWTSGKNVKIFRDSFANNGNIVVSEAGTWAAGFSAGNRTSLCQNQQAYYVAGNFGATC